MTVRKKEEKSANGILCIEYTYYINIYIPYFGGKIYKTFQKEKCALDSYL